ncbi:type III pantothenate kinase [Candidatus Omnitrophota bacterium]
MTALFDSGNSRLHFGLWDNGSLIEPASFGYPETPGHLYGVISDLLRKHAVHKAAACSVSSQWREPLFKALNDLLPGKCSVCLSASDIGIEVRYDNPSTYGVDRALAAYAAYRFFKDSCVVIDVGTAVTVDAVTKDGTIAGGYILPSAASLSQCLSERTDLPEVTVEKTGDGIGTSTEQCISYGITMGVSGAVKHLISHACNTVKSFNRLIITGGGAQELLNSLPPGGIHKPYLVLEGLGLSFEALPKYS